MSTTSDEGFMNKEEQYRYGLFPQADPIPQWVKDRVAEAAHDHKPAPAAVIAETEELIRRMRSNALNRLRAVELLNWDDSQGNAGLLQHTQRLAKEDPEHEADLWAAMWTLRHTHEDEQRCEQLLPQYADALEVMQRRKEFGWPGNWSDALAQVWTDAGGNNASARAWANAGWQPTGVLLLNKLPYEGRNLSLSERVTALRVPLRDDEQFPPIRIARPIDRNFTPSASRGNR